MKKTLLAIAATLTFGYANAQMKLGNNPTTTNADALLEMETTNKGLLLPRIALTSTTAFAPLTAHVAGMAVYNTATAGDVTPGYYFSDGAKWVKIADAATAGGSNIYTADGTLTGARTVTMGSNNLSFNGTGNIGIGTTTPNASAALDITATDKGFLMPRCALTSTTSFAPLAAHVAGMSVYNTATTGDVVPGSYINDGTKWNPVNVATSNVKAQYAASLNIPPTSSYVADFTAHANATYDKSNWQVVSKATIAGSAATGTRMTVVYEYQGTAFNLANLFPFLTPGNNTNAPDVYAANFVNLQTFSGKTRLTVTINRLDAVNNPWAGTFPLNLLLINN